MTTAGDATRATTRRLVLAALLCVVVVALVYVVFVRTRRGQELDDGAYEGHHASGPEPRGRPTVSWGRSRARPCRCSGARWSSWP